MEIFISSILNGYYGLVMKTILIFIIVILSINEISAQDVFIDGIPRDTSFTLHSAYIKEKKYKPYIDKVTDKLPANVISYENVVYSHPYEGRDLHMNIYRPSDNKKYPALLMVHGGGWSSGDLTLQIPMAQQIAASGYVAIPVEYRLSPEAIYPAAVYDLKTAVRWIRANAGKYDIDTTRIAISGCSAGGQLAALIGTTNGQSGYEDKKEHAGYSSKVHAVLNIDGVTDFTKAELNSNKAAIAKGKKAPAAVRWFGGTFEEKKENWMSASSAFQVTAQSAPVCFINSSIDRFHDGRDEMIEKLNGFGIYSEVHTIPDTPHPFWLFKPWFEVNIKYMVNFLDKIFK